MQRIMVALCALVATTPAFGAGQISTFIYDLEFVRSGLDDSASIEILGKASDGWYGDPLQPTLITEGRELHLIAPKACKDFALAAFSAGHRLRVVGPLRHAAGAPDGLLALSVLGEKAACEVYRRKR